MGTPHARRNQGKIPKFHDIERVKITDENGKVKVQCAYNKFKAKGLSHTKLDKNISISDELTFRLQMHCLSLHMDMSIKLRYQPLL